MCGTKPLKDFGPSIPPTAQKYWADQTYHMNTKDPTAAYHRVMSYPYDQRKDQFCKEVSNEAVVCCTKSEKKIPDSTRKKCILPDQCNAF